MLHESVCGDGAGARTNTLDASGRPRWFCQEVKLGRFSDGRALLESRLWSADGGHVGSTVQDGLVRITEGNNFEGVYEQVREQKEEEKRERERDRDRERGEGIRAKL